MNDAQIRISVIAGYLVALLGVGYAASLFGRGTRKDYLLASHSVGPVLLLLCMFGTTMTAFAMVGSSAEAYKKGIGIYGLMASSSGILHSLCVFLIGTRLWKLGKQYGYTTQIQFFQDRLDSRLVGWVLFPVLVGLIIPYMLIGVIGAGLSIQGMTAGAFPDWDLFNSARPSLDGGVPPWMGTLAVCVVVLAYVFLGGMRGTTWANAGQTLLFMALGLVAFYMLAMKIGNGGDFWTSLKNTMSDVNKDLLTRENFSHISFLTYLLIPLSLGMFPHLFQHWLTAKSAKSFRLAIIMHPIFIMLVWVPCIYIGVWGTVVELPAAVQANPNLVLPWLVQTRLSPLVAGLLTAGILAAIMSSLDSQILCVGTMFAGDVIGGTAAGKRLSDQQQMWVARIFVVVVMAATWVISIALIENTSVFGLAIWCFTGFSGLFPLVFAALYWRRLTAAGALSAVLTMAASWGFLFYKSGWGAIQDYSCRVTPFGFQVDIEPVAVVFVATTLSMVLTSLLTKAPDSRRLERFFPAKVAVSR